ncbi:hypothetical protein NEPAR06_0175 [Nematocida parisii]|nr:hypothetical protein NEPAR08_0557 [Nematocida parisii]KAI5127921.1 hypothetical protein NEPAR03_1201 [Nematocida parisii]KAI5143140.1 hypothetical protein NEPAR07_0502 [Nematocida parisii]KAI5153097.1 hypothetical protein NEPAR06_0175 [Nematocida parisii]KAI5156432.1 hypothetical protein NEPAR05_0562 [Nematocida parisii]
MSKKYSGMVFSKERTFVPSTEEEREILANLNRKIHGNDLEDDFFTLADGLREERDEDSDLSSGIEMSDLESDCSHNEEQKTTTLHAKEAEKENASAKSALPKDCFASLIDQVNKQSGGSFSALSNMFVKEKRVKNKRRPESSIEECNRILSRLGEYSANYIKEEPEAEPAPVAKTPKKLKTNDKCENWEDATTNSNRIKPNII